MRKDNRPYIIKKTYLNIQRLYVSHFLKPQFEFLGKGFFFMSPWYVKLFGEPISIDNYATIIASPDQRIYLSIWAKKNHNAHIKIGKYCIICPGVRISSASGIDISDNCMIANNVYITDCDWHGIYNRISTGNSSPITLKNNVWIGDSAIICKGVTIGENSIIGAGSIVINSVPANTIVAGNPAKPVKALNPKKTFIKRNDFFKNSSKLFKDFDQIDRTSLNKNTLFKWLHHLIFPSKYT